MRFQDGKVYEKYPSMKVFRFKKEYELVKLMKQQRVILMWIDIICSIINIWVVTVLYFKVFINFNLAFQLCKE